MSSPVYLSTVSAIGLYANLPAFGIGGRKYHATDTNQDFYDTGTSWVNITAGGGEPFSSPPQTLVAPNGGTTYALSPPPLNPTASFYFVNGVKKKYGLFYSISGATLTLLIPAQAPTTGDSHEIYYS